MRKETPLVIFFALYVCLNYDLVPAPLKRLVKRLASRIYKLSKWLALGSLDWGSGGEFLPLKVDFPLPLSRPPPLSLGPLLSSRSCLEENDTIPFSFD